MKVLFLGFQASTLPIDANFSTLANSSPFGYDVIVVDPITITSILGRNGVDIDETIERWREALTKWFGDHHRIIVIQRPFDYRNGHTNYAWLDLNLEAAFQDCGNNTYMGQVIATDSYVKNFLNKHNSEFTISAYYQPQDENPKIVINAKIEEGIYSSFSWKDGKAEIIFIPVTPILSICDFIRSLEIGSTLWKVDEAIRLEASINEVDKKIDTLALEKQALLDDLLSVNIRINDLLQTDIYLRRAVDAFNTIQVAHEPSPESYYEAIEAIEKAFDSEAKMRDELNLSKNYIDTVMRRANDFRHVARTGQKPDPLTVEEKREFGEKIDNIIRKYLGYLYRGN